MLSRSSSSSGPEREFGQDNAAFTVLHENGELRMGARPPRVEVIGDRIRMNGESDTVE